MIQNYQRDEAKDLTSLLTPTRTTKKQENDARDPKDNNPIDNLVL